MSERSCRSEPKDRRRGAAAVMVVMMLPVLIGFAAITVDVAIMQNTRADLQNAADAAALAAVSTYATDAMMQVRMGKDPYSALSTVDTDARKAVGVVSESNSSFGRAGTVFSREDVTIGWIDATSSKSPFRTDVPPAQFNAVRAFARRTADSDNGPVRFLFASIFGKSESHTGAVAIAVLDDRFSGYETATPGPGAMPFTIDVNEYNRQLLEGGDAYSFSQDSDTVFNTPDGVREVNLYPYKSAPGNFGILNIGIGSTASSEISRQINEGVSPLEFERETGSSELTFYDDAGDPVNYEISGTPGLKSSLEADLVVKVGEVVSYFVHDSVWDGGSNTTYRIVGMRFGRIMGARISGGADQGLWIQPVTFEGAGVRTEPRAPSSGGVAGRAMLAR